MGPGVSQGPCLAHVCVPLLHLVRGSLGPAVLWLGPGAPCFAACGVGTVWIGWGLAARSGLDPRCAPWPGEQTQIALRGFLHWVSAQISNLPGDS